MPRRERDWVLGEFKSGRSPILIATDVASRGLGMSIPIIPGLVSNNQEKPVMVSIDEKVASGIRL